MGPLYGVFFEELSAVSQKLEEQADWVNAHVVFLMQEPPTVI